MRSPGPQQQQWVKASEWWRGGGVLLPMVGNGGLMYAQPQPQDMTTLLNIIRGHGKGRPSGGPNCRRANAAYAQSMG